MYLARTLRLSAASVAAVVAVGTVGALPAEAGKPGPPPTGLAATVNAHQNGRFDVATSWDAVANATSYRVSLTKVLGGATLSSATVSTNSWNPAAFNTSPGDARLSVRAVLGKKPGKTATLTVPLPDVVAPEGAFSAASDNNTGVATITQDSLTDNAPVSGVIRTVNWGDGSGLQLWTGSNPITHHYTLTPAQEVRYPAKVTLEDGAGNVTVVLVNPAPVFNDFTKPVGDFAAGPTAAWAKLTTVTVTQNALSDDRTPTGFIARTIDWGDGSTVEAWTTGTTIDHVFTVVPTKPITVTATDEAGNQATFPMSVDVKVDSVAPAVKLTLPKSKRSVKAWRTLRGKATDAGTGVKSVWLKAVEKRGAAWYGYNATTHAWAKAKTKTKAFSKAKAFSLTTNARHQWAAKLVKLRKGTLVYKVRATDQVNNTSAILTRTARLTRR
jgi:hypothetical protein